MILSFINKFRDLGLLILRLCLGLTFTIIHGYPKLAAGAEGWKKFGESMKYLGITFYPEFWGFMPGFAEFFGGIILLTGLFFRPGMLLLIINMLVAFLSMYGRTGAINQSTYPLEILAVMIALFFTGPGKYSLDERLFK
jgi:putative oxidoreductase